MSPQLQQMAVSSPSPIAVPVRPVATVVTTPPESRQQAVVVPAQIPVHAVPTSTPPPPESEHERAVAIAASHPRPPLDPARTLTATSVPTNVTSLPLTSTPVRSIAATASPTSVSMHAPTPTAALGLGPSPDLPGLSIELNCSGSQVVGDLMKCSVAHSGDFLESAYWTAPGGSPAKGMGTTFETQFYNPGQASIVLEACGRALGCSSAVHRFQVTDAVAPDRTESKSESVSDGKISKSAGGVLIVLPECMGQMFTLPPVDLTEVYEITPLGNLGPPGHTFPTEHMYFHISAGGTSTRKVPLRAPGDIYIIDVSGGEDLDQGEFSMIFSLCRDLFGYFNHIKTLSDEVKEAIAAVGCQQWTVNPANICSRRVIHRVGPGTILGEVGDLQGNFDFGAFDYRTKHAFANPARYGSRSPFIVCPLDLYESPTREQLYEKIVRNAEPLCGQVLQDLLGTLQGNWFYEGKLAKNIWSQHLAFVHDNHDPSTAVISVGGVFMDPVKWEFVPKAKGLVNRDFAHVTPDGHIYCYDEGQRGRILLQLSDEMELKIEYQGGGCTSDTAFERPTVYRR